MSVFDVFKIVTSSNGVKTLSINPTKWSNTLKQIGPQFGDELFECV